MSKKVVPQENFKPVESKPERVPFEQCGVAILFKKKVAPVESATGIKLVPLGEDGKPNWAADGMLIWFRELDSLRKGAMDRIGVFQLLQKPKPGQ